MQMFMVFYILCMSIFQVTGADNSTQMIYMRLNIDQSVYANLSQVLTSFGTYYWTVNSIIQTTNCTPSATVRTCSCMQGYTWNDTVCQTQNCCGSTTCNFTHPARCVADTTVTIQGSITLKSQSYQDCLADKTKPIYSACDYNLTTQMQTIYSTLDGFDNLTIQNYSVGSVIANFQIILASGVSSQNLTIKSQNVTSALNASIHLTTTGVVVMTMPPGPLKYGSSNTVSCSSIDDLGTSPTWTLQQPGVVNKICTGTQAIVTAVSKTTSVYLNSITELWKGTYTCTYIINNPGLTITHQASDVMDVALEPSISISVNPQFPQCTDSSGLLSVQINCQITQIGENYTVTWSSPNIAAALIPVSYSSGSYVYSANTVVSCGSSNQEVTCVFTNRCNQTRNASIVIDTHIIQAGEKYCVANGVWPNGKIGLTAVLPCANAAGQLLRNCLAGGVWDVVNSQCVLPNLNDVLQKSAIVGIGLGETEENTAVVFNQLNNATNDTLSISTFSNVNASIQVLSNIQNASVNLQNASAIRDFVASSSNILGTTKTSWTNNNNNNNNTAINLTLAERYLESFEAIISSTTNLTSQSQPNVEVDTCSGTECENNVFNVSVSLGGFNNGSVITTGFQALHNYLPCPDNVIPNSIVVSTIAGNNSLDSVEITIDFDLLSPRPRNVRMQCVAWDDVTRSWSTEGCTWQGASNPGLCVCTHLSSFAILMSAQPTELPWSSEITYVGLGVSVVSLLICLMIEISVWSTVVKTNTLYLRHTAHFNISLCLLIADSCFLASSIITLPAIWCQIFVVLKHFCYLAMFFWMLCLSITLLHQAVYLFHNVSKTSYLRFSLVLGYACPFLIVFITFIINDTGAEGSYYSSDGCWLVYKGLFQGSIFTFIIPVGIIVFINVFCMLVVIMKLLDHPKITDKSCDKEKNAAKTVMRTIILLTPIFGVTWLLGFVVMILDLTSGTVVFVVNYAFILLNAFQGLFVLLTTCIGDRMVRETVLSRFRKKAPASISESTTKLDSSLKK